MKGNPHYENARALLVRAEHASVPEMADALARAAYTEAVLAQAFEQCTANLLAVTEKMYQPGANDEVKKRLGWPEGVGTPTPEPMAPASEALYSAAIKTVTDTLIKALHDITYSYDEDDKRDINVDGSVSTINVAMQVVEDLRQRGCL